VTASSAQPDEQAVRNDLADYFGPRGRAYLAHYDRRRARALAGRRALPLSWSWSVFGAWFAWFWYRKLWGWGALALAVPLLADWLIGGQSALVGLLLVAMTANDCYLQAAMTVLRQADRLGLAGAERTAFLRRRGGVSWTAGILAALLVIGLGVLSALRALPEIVRQLDAAGLLPPG
jgi:hypothetical protein